MLLSCTIRARSRAVCIGTLRGENRHACRGTPCTGETGDLETTTIVDEMSTNVLCSCIAHVNAYPQPPRHESQRDVTPLSARSFGHGAEAVRRIQCARVRAPCHPSLITHLVALGSPIHLARLHFALFHVPTSVVPRGESSG